MARIALAGGWRTRDTSVDHLCGVPRKRQSPWPRRDRGGRLSLPEQPWLQHDGSSSLAHLWTDHRHRLRAPVWANSVRAIRTRPVFPEWAADIEVHICPMRLNAEKVLDLFRYAGEHIGIGGGRPCFGRFTVEAI
jgi:hypothetical protein